MDLSSHGYLLAFQLRFKKYLLFFTVLDSVELLKLLSTFLTIPDILHLAKTNKHLSRMLSYPFIQIRLLRRQVKQLQQQRPNLRLDESHIQPPLIQFHWMGHQESNSIKPIKAAQLFKSLGSKPKRNPQSTTPTMQSTTPATSQKTVPEKAKVVAIKPEDIEFQDLLIEESWNIRQRLKRDYKEVAYNLLYYSEQKALISPLFGEKRPSADQPVDKKVLLQKYRVIQAEKQVRSLLRQRENETDPSNYILYREFNKLQRCSELEKRENEFRELAKGVLKREPLEMFQFTRTQEELQMRERSLSRLHREIKETPISIRVIKNLMLPLWQVGRYVGKIRNDHGL